MLENDIVDYLFELTNGEQVFVECSYSANALEAQAYLESQLDEELGVEKFLGLYSVDEAEMLGYDTY